MEVFVKGKSRKFAFEVEFVFVAIAPMGVELGPKLDNDESWLRWWDEAGNLLLSGDERALKAEVMAEQQRASTKREISQLFKVNRS